MTKTDIFSGFLGAGKTTLIRKLISESYKGEKLVLIENEFGDIAIDGAFLQDAGIEITEMNSGCICCTLVGDFREALQKVVKEFAPDRILIEPSGVGKLSDVAEAVRSVDGIEIGTKVIGSSLKIVKYGFLSLRCLFLFVLMIAGSIFVYFLCTGFVRDKVDYSSFFPGILKIGVLLGIVSAFFLFLWAF